MWAKVSLDIISMLKSGMMTAPMFETKVLVAFHPDFECLKDFARSFRKVLFRGESGIPVKDVEYSDSSLG
ncbi:hypothetical protein BC938DRAFT_482675 [Jimgerdemannia flammicorona]|uniref:Uncharacterized protein n=1 Tax=Jimgerdemannia flammicorona TaxID=994334 RepID=A0A433QDE1_9FUNG|nr:hypothetical protein BC938DRAFT_482675 [Jimgerdemannia flammicorona]